MNFDVNEEEKTFIAECILIAAREGYWLTTTTKDSWELGVDLCKRLGMSESFCEEVERG